MIVQTRGDIKRTESFDSPLDLGGVLGCCYFDSIC